MEGRNRVILRRAGYYELKKKHNFKLLAIEEARRF